VQNLALRGKKNIFFLNEIVTKIRRWLGTKNNKQMVTLAGDIAAFRFPFLSFVVAFAFAERSINRLEWN